MIEQLQQLSLALSHISGNEAKRVADAVNAKIVGLLEAQVGKLYWSEEAKDGVLLKPMSFINNTPSPNPLPFQIGPEHKGILSWVFENRRPLWLEDLRRKDLRSPVTNEATGDPVPAEYLDMSDTTWLESMMVVPLVIHGDIRGLYSVELQISGKLKRSILGLLLRIAGPLAGIFWDADVYAYNERRTADVVSHFVNLAAAFSFDRILIEGVRRSGFIARPFEPQFSDVEAKISSLLQARRIRARAYQPETGRLYIMDDIQRQIRHSHFCIADLTGLNPNVMAEVGMMMVLNKHFLLLRRRGEAAVIPFDVSHVPVYEYELRSGEEGLHVWNTAQDRYQSFDAVLDSFIEQLPAETGFSSAPEWTPGTE